MTRYLQAGKRALFLLVFPVCIVVPALGQQKVNSFKKAEQLLEKNIVATGLGKSMLSELRVTAAYEDKRAGTFQIYAQQLHLGVPVYNKISVYTFRNDTLLVKQQDFVRRFPAATAKTTGYFVDPQQAVRLASNHFSIPLMAGPQLIRQDDDHKRFVYRAAGLGLDSTTAELVWLPIAETGLIKLAWNVRVATPDQKGDWFVRIDAQSGEYLDDNSLIVSEKREEDCNDGPATFNQRSGATKKTASSTMTFFRLFTPASNNPVTGRTNMEQKSIQPTARQVGKAFGATPPSAWAPAPPTVASASYRVYPIYTESQNFGNRVLETNPWLRAGAGNDAVTLGWHYDNNANYDITRGNNVWAQENITGAYPSTGISDNSSTAIPALTFDKPLDFAQNPSVNSNLRAATDNLFYWNNVMHDVTYQYGFDEAAGNFQADNLNRGGLGNDFVNAHSEDGAGMNNANFTTPPDGEKPRMRMYQWNTATTPSLLVSAPAAAANTYMVVESGMTLTSQLAYTGNRSGSIIWVVDQSGQGLGCGTLANAAAINGNIALIDRGGNCNFAAKIKSAQNAGAVAVIVANNIAGQAPFTMTGSDLSINIPAVMISYSDAVTLKSNMPGLTGTVRSTGLLRDGSIDNGIIAHEYVHGISNRLTGGPAAAGCLVNAEQMGEGWSDYVSLMVTTNWATTNISDGPNPRTIGTYAISQAASGPGIRNYPYSTNLAVNPWNYSMMAGNTSGEPHTIGEIWCATIWDMTWNIIQQEGIDADIYHGTKGNNIALQLVIAGMKYQPCSPGFLDARDAILKADSILYNYAHKCAIWNAFARRGMGRSASQGSSASYLDQSAASDVPLGLGIGKTASKNFFVKGDDITYTITAQCDCAALSNITIVDTLPPGLTYVSSSGGNFGDPAVRFTGVNFTAGQAKTFTVVAKVAGTVAAPVKLIDDTRDPANYTWTQTALSSATTFLASSTRAHSGTNSWFAPNMSFATNFVMTSADVVLDTLATLSFWHYWETDPAYDGGMVEISTDGGSSWQDLGPYMTQNGYNGTLDPVNTGASNRPAFTASSGGQFIQTIVTLTGFAGKTARIRFHFASDPFVGGTGWWIDDILLQNEKGIVNNAFAFNGGTLLSRNMAYGFFNTATLPVTFIAFDAKKQGSTSALHWKVAEEMNVAKYVVERSTDGTDFSAIGEVPYSNYAAAEKDYYFNDEHPVSGTNYYRIAEVDIDGRSMRSTIALVRFTGGPVLISISPVPTYTHKVQLNIENAGRGTFKALLLNSVGQVLNTYKVQNGTNALNLGNAGAGVYYLKVEMGDGKTEVKKLVVD